MSLSISQRVSLRILSMALSVFFSLIAPATTAFAQTTAFRQAVAEASALEDDIAAWYRSTSYDALWTSADDAARRNAFLSVVAAASDHGLPVSRYDAATLRLAYRDARTESDRGRLEVMMTRAFIAYARDIQTGVLVPSKVDAGIVRDIPIRNPLANLAAFASSDPMEFLRALPPAAPAYARLMKEKITLQNLIDKGGWGARVPATSLQPSDSGAPVVALRNRLIAQGYMAPNATQTYDHAIRSAVQAFQLDHGLEGTGIASEGTMDQLNIGPEERISSVLVAMERERWLNMDRGNRYVWVNLTDFTAKIIENGKEAFSTRAVIGKNEPDRRTPEFSDQIEFMVINPSWNVPRSITTREYLPLMQRNPNAARQLKIIDGNGREVPRNAINFAAYTAKTFPFAMRQPPSDGNALGLVKFMFPNENNIYLHDTPAKSLFAKEVRDFSHGCIRLQDPFDFAYALLALQTDDPKGEFASKLATGKETPVNLAKSLPVHLVYFTAFPSVKGKMNYRRDVYGRDARIYDALLEAGVALRGVQG